MFKLLKESGEARVHKTGKSLLVNYEPYNSLFPHKLFINLEALKRVLEGKQTSVRVVELVHESHVSEKFDA